MKLRPYQRETHDSLREHYERGLNRLLVRLFTGAGKTSAIAAKLPETFPVLARYGVLFLSHRREILQQAYAVFEASYAGFKWCGIDMGEREATGLEDFVFGSFDALGRLTSNRILKYSRRYFGIVIVDEGHHATKEGTWDNVLNYFGVGSDKTQHIRLPGSNLKPLSVFLTATPQRHDGRPLHPFLDAVAADYDIRYAIREGWLTDIMAYRATFDAFDYDKMSDAEQTDFIIKMWERYAKGMRTLVFARSVDQSALIAGTINKFFAGEGHKAAHVSSRGVFGPDGLEAAPPIVVIVTGGEVDLQLVVVDAVALAGHEEAQAAGLEVVSEVAENQIDVGVVRGRKDRVELPRAADPVAPPFGGHVFPAVGPFVQGGLQRGHPGFQRAGVAGCRHQFVGRRGARLAGRHGIAGIHKDRVLGAGEPAGAEDHGGGQRTGQPVNSTSVHWFPPN